MLPPIRFSRAAIYPIDSDKGHFAYVLIPDEQPGKVIWNPNSESDKAELGDSEALAALETDMLRPAKFRPSALLLAN